jgi:methylenetetrahydrofolate--tRNA-(uracil-5-)-methyltransferase
MNERVVTVVGGGFAGCEAAWAAANRGARVKLYEMRPSKMTPAHKTDKLAELVCSNSFKSNNPNSPAGVLKEEMTALGSLMIPTALKHSVPGGEALAVDRDSFAKEMTNCIESHHCIEVIRSEFNPETFDFSSGPLIIATGPLTSDAVSLWLSKVTSRTHLYFYDAVSPTVTSDSIDRSIVWLQSRYDKGDAAYLNCPFTKDQYEQFIDTLLRAEQAPLHDFEKGRYFEGCMPIEEIAARGRDSLRFGNFKPVGLKNPKTGERAYAVVQLRPENREKTLYSLVACQTRMKWGPQKEVLRMIPGLQNAEFVRLGVIHRNTYVDSPRVLNSDLSLDPERTNLPRGATVFLAGQLTGVEGYVESGATGILAGIAAIHKMEGLNWVAPPRESAYGSLVAHVTNDASPEYAPMNINWGLFPDPEPDLQDKSARRAAKLRAAKCGFDSWLTSMSKTLVNAG